MLEKVFCSNIAPSLSSRKLKKKFLTPSPNPQIKDKGGWVCTNIRLDSDVSHSTEIIVYYCWGGNTKVGEKEKMIIVGEKK